MPSSTLITDYLGRGTSAARPASPPVASGALSVYYATDTDIVSVWNGTAWEDRPKGTVTQIIVGPGLTGGTITGTGTVALESIGTLELMANVGTAAAAAGGVSLSAFLDAALSDVQGSVIVRNATGWVVLAPGQAGQVLSTGGTAADVSWINTPGSSLAISSNGSQVTTSASILNFSGSAVHTTIDATNTSQADVVISLPTITPGHVLGTVGTASAEASDVSLSAVMDVALGNVQGDVLFRGATGWEVLAPGTAGQVLQSGGTGADPSWVTPSGGSGGSGSLVVQESGTAVGTVTTLNVTGTGGSITATGSVATLNLTASGGGSGGSSYTTFSGQTTSSSTTGAQGANTILFVPFNASASGTLANIQFNFATALVGNAQAALYDATGTSGGPGALLAASAQVTNPPAGMNTFAVSGTVNIESGTKYWVAINTSANGNYASATTTGSCMDQSYTEGSYPATATPVSYSGLPTPNCGINIKTNSSILGETSLYLNAPSAALANITWTDVPWTSAYSDKLGAWSSSDPTHVKVPTGASEFRAVCRTSWASNSNGARQMWLLINRGGTDTTIVTDTHGANYESANGMASQWRACTPGDLIRLSAKQSSGGSLALNGQVLDGTGWPGPTFLFIEWR